MTARYYHAFALCTTETKRIARLIDFCIQTASSRMMFQYVDYIHVACSLDATHNLRSSTHRLTLGGYNEISSIKFSKIHIRTELPVSTEYSSTINNSSSPFWGQCNMISLFSHHRYVCYNVNGHFLLFIFFFPSFTWSISKSFCHNVVLPC